VTATATLLQVQPESPELDAIACAAARRHGVPPHEVFVRLLLHLPRDADARGMVESRLAARESERVARDLAAATDRYSAWQAPPAAGALDVGAIDLVSASEATARVVLERFHYLSSFRPGSEHLAGVLRDGDEERLVALLTISALDVPTIAARLPRNVEPDRVAVLSRVFAFDWAPRNTLSFLMARAVRTLRNRAKPPRLLVTYLNPNVGFSGASYRAANWVLWARESGTRYAYLDGRYTSDRELLRRFGSTDADALDADRDGKLTFSKMPLRPLDLYAYPLDPRLRDRLVKCDPIELPRPTP
jgi:hypothetical protein